jgi:ATP/maltotriose-dependent transcriptional regulator MalT
MMDIMAIASTCCYLIDTCERVRDFDRAAQWSVHMKALCTRWQMKSTFAICRSQYAAVLMWRGQWAQAEAELEWATNLLEVTRPNLISESLVRLAELRHRQGRLEEAVSLYSRIDTHSLAQAGRAALALDQNKPSLAIDIAERFLRHLPPDSQTDRAAVLENLAQAYILTANYDQAKATVHELGSLAALIGTEPLAASYNYAEGLLALSIGNHETARQRFEDAVVLFERNGAPFETARARLMLARACAALGRSESALLETQAAHQAFSTLGAVLEARRAEMLLHDLDIKNNGAKDSIALSRREREVAALISQGLTNREIAEQLVLSERTIESHVSNILSKLGFTVRSQIAVWASEKHLASP